MATGNGWVAERMREKVDCTNASILATDVSTAMVDRTRERLQGKAIEVEELYATEAERMLSLLTTKRFRSTLFFFGKPRDNLIVRKQSDLSLVRYANGCVKVKIHGAPPISQPSEFRSSCTRTMVGNTRREGCCLVSVRQWPGHC